MVLVTGGTGFLGAYIIQELVDKGHRVRAIRRSGKMPDFISPAVMAQVEWMEGDVLDVVSLEEAMQGVDTVIHAAAIVSFYKRDRKAMYQVNVDGTANVVNMALEANIRRFVHISSVASLGRLANAGSVSEEKKWEENKINSHYAKTKYKAELEVWRGIGEGLSAVILNPSTIIGYGDWNSGSCSIFKSIYNGFNWYTPGINGFVGVEDIARATVLLMESTITEERFIINTDNWTFRELMNTIADGFGKKHPSKATTPFLINLAWRMEALKSALSSHKPILTKETARIGYSKTIFENAKILQAIPGFAFTPLEDCIREACKKYLAKQGVKPA